MLLRRSVGLGLGLFVLTAPATGSTGLLADVVGYPVKLLLGSTIDKAKTDLDTSVSSALDNVDRKLSVHEERISDLAGALLDKGKNILDTSILNITSGVDASVDRALGKLQFTGDELIDRLTTNADGLIKELQADVVKDLKLIDTILKNRTADIDKLLEARTNQINSALQERIIQIDEVARGRLGDVNAIATKQRLELESTLMRLAVMVGSIVFLIFVLVRLWLRYLELGTVTQRGPRRAAFLVSKLVPTLVAPTLVAGCALLLLGSLYRWLPAGAVQQLENEVGIHRALLAGSVLRVDPPRARFEASILSHLDAANTSQYDGLAAKSALIRDVIAIPTLLASEAGVARFSERLKGIERALGPVPDPDSLTLHALLVWKTGETRQAEHRAASLAARALNLAPRGFAMAPLARAYVQTFLSQPYFAPDEGESRDAMGLDQLSDALALSSPEPADSPFAGVTKLAELIRGLEAKSSTSYAKMVEANAAAVSAFGPGPQPRDKDEVGRQLALRTQEANQVVSAWVQFDEELQKSEVIQGSLVLNVFGLNDAPYSRARYFADHPRDVSRKAKGLTELKLPERLKAAPARIAWSRRYAELLGGTTRALLELEEARQFKIWERFALELEDALVAKKEAEAAKRDSSESRWRAAVAAAALGLYVSEDDGTRAAYAERLAAGLKDAPPGVNQRSNTRAGETKQPSIVGAPEHLVELLQTRGQRLI